MKSISRYSQALVCFVTIIFSLLIMNLISGFMLMRLGKKAEQDTVSNTYFFAGYELCYT